MNISSEYTSEYNRIQRKTKNRNFFSKSIQTNDSNHLSRYLVNSRHKSTIGSSPFKILQEYEQTLIQELQGREEQKQLRRQKKKMHQLKILANEQSKSKKLIAEMESIKYRLKELSLQRESAILKKQRLIKLKTQNCHVAHLNGRINPYSVPIPYPSHNQPSYFPQYAPNIHNPYENPSNLYAKRSIEATNSSFYNSRSLVLQRRPTKNINKTPQQTENQDEQYLPQLRKKQKGLLQKNKQKDTKFKKRINDLRRYQNKDLNRKRLRKCFLAVYFMKCLQKLYRKIKIQRHKFFVTFWPQQLIKFQQSFKGYFFQNFSPFFKLLKQTQNSCIMPSEEDSKGLKLQKNKTIRKLIQVYFQCFKDLKNIQSLGKLAWGFCKNGSFVHNKVLTEYELSLLSFNQRYGCLQMDIHLEKYQIVGFIFIKTILYKFVLSPWKRQPKQANPSFHKILTQNIKVIGSILYKLFISLQDEYLDCVDDKKYPLGNYKKVRTQKNEVKIECAAPLLFNTKTVQNELISGLYPDQVIKKHISLKKLTAHLQTARQVIQKIQSTSYGYQKQFRNKLHSKVIKTNYIY